MYVWHINLARIPTSLQYIFKELFRIQTFCLPHIQLETNWIQLLNRVEKVHGYLIATHFTVWPSLASSVLWNRFFFVGKKAQIAAEHLKEEMMSGNLVCSLFARATTLILILTYLFTCLVPLLGHRPPTRILQVSLSWAFTSCWFQVSPNLLMSASRSQHDVFLSHPLFLLPWGLQVRACLVMLVGGLQRVWPTHLILILPVNNTN